MVALSELTLKKSKYLNIDICSDLANGLCRIPLTWNKPIYRFLCSTLGGTKTQKKNILKRADEAKYKHISRDRADRLHTFLKTNLNLVVYVDSTSF